MVKWTTVLIISIVLILWLPTDPITDAMITLPIISAIGMNNYILISIVLIIIGCYYIQGKTIKAKFSKIKHEVKKVM